MPKYDFVFEIETLPGGNNYIQVIEGFDVFSPSTRISKGVNWWIRLVQSKKDGKFILEVRLSHTDYVLLNVERSGSGDVDRDRLNVETKGMHSIELLPGAIIKVNTYKERITYAMEKLQNNDCKSVITL